MWLGAAFQHVLHRGPGLGAPLLLLHGSGLDERAMMGFARAVAPDGIWIAPRGQVPVGDGHAFFRRHPDRSLDLEDLDLRAHHLCDFIAEARTRYRLPGPPILAGFSNGAIMAAALVALRPDLSHGAILMRPLAPRPDRAFPRLDGYPVLILSGARDERRDPQDGAVLERQLRAAGAAVTACVLPTGHGETTADRMLAADWLARHGAANAA